MTSFKIFHVLHAGVTLTIHSFKIFQFSQWLVELEFLIHMSILNSFSRLILKWFYQFQS